MNYKKINKKRLFGILNLFLGISLIGVSFFAVRPKESNQITNNKQQIILDKSTTTKEIPEISSAKEKSYSNQYSIELLINDKKLSLNFTPGDTLEKVIKDAVSKNLVNIKGENFSGLGFFVESINGIEAKNGNTWIYYINGKKATVGVSSYKLQKEDLIEWKYEPIKSF